jgi:hypothetical protein
MLQTLLNIIHVTVCLFLILVVLLQQGRGGGMGSAFGGATAQVFGGRGCRQLPHAPHRHLRGHLHAHEHRPRVPVVRR